MVAQLAELENLLAQAQEWEAKQETAMDKKEYMKCKEEVQMKAWQMIRQIEEIGKQIANIYNRNAGVLDGDMIIKVKYDIR